jgi:hypothetical protein
MSTRKVRGLVPSIAAQDGAGVRLRRSIGSEPGRHFDPFLLLDEFSSDDPDDYIAGFPPHPHRGFETVTYMLEGHMLHEDHLGNRGDLRTGGVQWMTAGRGIIHSEMPQQTEGRLRGFQLWLNLPARLKMQPAAYRDLDAGEIPEHDLPGGRIKLIAGRIQIDGRTVAGAVTDRATDPHFFDLSVGAGRRVEIELPASYNAFAYLVDGTAEIAAVQLPRHGAALLSDGGTVQVDAGADGARLLLLAARPIGEPVVQYGPFVMTTREEIEQALQDYRDNRLTAAG